MRRLNFIFLLLYTSIFIGCSTEPFNYDDLEERYGTVYYKDEPYSGEAIKYYDKLNEQVWIKEKYKNGKLDGPRTVSYENGQTQEKQHYIAGVKVGKWISYNELGNESRIEIYVDGLLDGKFTTYLGDKYSETGQYNMGVKIGTWKEYDSFDGKVSKIIPYDDQGKLHGVVKSFYPSPQKGLMDISEYEHGVEIGIYKSFHENGSVKMMVPHNTENDTLYRSHYSDNGQLLYREWGLKNSAMWQRLGPEYHSNGNLKEIITELNGLAVKTHYFQNGLLESVRRTINDTIHGVQERYFKTGQLLSHSEYNMGTPIGTHTRFYDDGQMVTSTSYDDDGHYHGVNRTWNRNGTPSKITEFNHGKHHGIHVTYGGGNYGWKYQQYRNGDLISTNPPIGDVGYIFDYVYSHSFETEFGDNVYFQRNGMVSCDNRQFDLNGYCMTGNRKTKFITIMEGDSKGHSKYTLNLDWDGGFYVVSASPNSKYLFKIFKK